MTRIHIRNEIVNYVLRNQKKPEYKTFADAIKAAKIKCKPHRIEKSTYLFTGQSYADGYTAQGLRLFSIYKSLTKDKTHFFYISYINI